jgi:RNA polymerase sigma-70 factor, ECF subfamily
MNEPHRTTADIWSACRDAWPGLSVTREQFLSYAAERVDTEYVTDLYLACACAHGDATALRAFDAQCLAELGGIVNGIANAGVGLDEIKQALREKLFVRGPEKAPAILEYSGKGPLSTWVFVVATRVALNLVRGLKVPVPNGDARMLAIAAPDANQELSYLKELYSKEFAEVLASALAGLPERDRTLLRQHYVDGVTLKQLATVYGVHRVTMVHWAERARDALRDRTHQLLLERLGITTQTLESITRLVESHFGDTLVQVLRGDAQR